VVEDYYEPVRVLHLLYTDLGEDLADRGRVRS